MYWLNLEGVDNKKFALALSPSLDDESINKVMSFADNEKLTHEPSGIKFATPTVLFPPDRRDWGSLALPIVPDEDVIYLQNLDWPLLQEEIAARRVGKYVDQRVSRDIRHIAIDWNGQSAQTSCVQCGPLDPETAIQNCPSGTRDGPWHGLLPNEQIHLLRKWFPLLRKIYLVLFNTTPTQYSRVQPPASRFEDVNAWWAELDPNQDHEEYNEHEMAALAAAQALYQASGRATAVISGFLTPVPTPPDDVSSSEIVSGNYVVEPSAI